MDSANLAEVPCRRPRMVLFIEGPRGAFGKLEALSVNRHEEISCAARNHLAGRAVGEASERLRAGAWVADFATVTSAGEYNVGCAHGSRDFALRQRPALETRARRSRRCCKTSDS